MTFKTGAMPRGGTYEELAETLAQFHLTFSPLKERGGDDARDFARMSEALTRMARRHRVPVPPMFLKEHPETGVFRTPSEAMDHLSAFIRDFGLCQEGDPHGTHDAGDRNALGQAILATLHRYGALIAKFDGSGGAPVAVGIDRWLGRAEREPMDRILDPARKEGR
jgi:hypothetical protein